jgi:hypothetical protein
LKTAYVRRARLSEDLGEIAQAEHVCTCCCLDLSRLVHRTMCGGGDGDECDSGGGGGGGDDDDDDNKIAKWNFKIKRFRQYILSSSVSVQRIRISNKVLRLEIMVFVLFS